MNPRPSDARASAVCLRGEHALCLAVHCPCSCHPENRTETPSVERPRAGRIRIIVRHPGEKDEQVEVDEAWLAGQCRERAFTYEPDGCPRCEASRDALRAHLAGLAKLEAVAEAARAIRHVVGPDFDRLRDALAASDCARVPVGPPLEFRMSKGDAEEFTKMAAEEQSDSSSEPSAAEIHAWRVLEGAADRVLWKFGDEYAGRLDELREALLAVEAARTAHAQPQEKKR
jgi:hypothetical protein